MRVTFAEIATANPMGQQAYEQAIQAAIADECVPNLELEALRVTSLRNPVSADRRLPWGLLERSPAFLARRIGAWTYRGVDLLHRLDLRLPPSSGPEVVTVHDLPGLRFDDEGRVPSFLAAGAAHAAAVIVPSTFAGQEVVDLLHVDPARLRVIPYGLSRTYAVPPQEPSKPELLTVPRPFVLHAAGATTRKNLAQLAAAWQSVAARVPKVHLLLCGPEDRRRHDAFAGLERVHLLGRLAPADVAWLMHRAEAVVVPSSYEGFGLPALEGMAAGVPVVAARAGALPEVCEDAALLVEPHASALADGLLTVLLEEDVRAGLISRGPKRAAAFDWGVAARHHIDVYREVGGHV